MIMINDKISPEIIFDRKLEERKRLLNKYNVSKGATLLIAGYEITVKLISEDFLIYLEENSSFFTILDPIRVLD